MSAEDAPAAPVVAPAAAAVPSASFRELKRAAEDGNVAMVEALLGRGVSQHEPPGTGNFTPAMLAAQYGRTEVLRVLIDAGAVLDTAGGSSMYTTINLAAGEGHAPALALLLAAGASANFVLKPSSHALLHALTSSSRGAPEVMRMLLDAGARVPDQDAWAAEINTVRTGG
jgi:ankyrin repeat protein